MKIAFDAPRNEFADALLQQLKQTLPQDEILPWLPKTEAPATDFEIVLALGPVPRERMQVQPKLGLIQTASDGYETVDMDAATELGIWVSYSPGDGSGNADSVAEYAVMLLIAACRRVGEALAYIQDHGTNRPLLNKVLKGKTVLIVGYGDIGAKIGDRLRPFGVKLAAVDKHTDSLPKDVKGYPVEALKHAVAQADAIVLAVRASKETEGMISAEVLQATKKGAVLVNIARGSLIDEKALQQAIKDGQLFAAGLDVVDEEPIGSENPLLQFPQIFVTPHIAGFSDLTLEGTTQYLAEVVNKFREGKHIDSLLNEPKSPRRALQS